MFVTRKCGRVSQCGVAYTVMLLIFVAIGTAAYYHSLRRQKLEMFIGVLEKICRSEIKLKMEDPRD